MLESCRLVKLCRIGCIQQKIPEGCISGGPSISSVEIRKALSIIPRLALETSYSISTYISFDSTCSITTIQNTIVSHSQYSVNQ